MAKDTEKAPKDARQERWDALLEAYAKQNPVKYAAKKERGEFDKIPADFQ